MQISALTQKGQVTIPAGVRKKLGLKTGTCIAFEEADGRVYLRAVPNTVDAAFGMVKAKRSVSLETMQQVIRRRAAP